MNESPTFNIEKQAAPLRQQVLDGLRQAIVTGQLAPGQRLTEPALIEMTGVSRTVIRESLRQLEAEGLVALIPNKGPVVRELTAEEAKDLYGIRAVLEGFAARLFVENADEKMIEQIGRALDSVIAAYDSGNAQRILDSKTRFYDVLYEGANSETLGSMLATVHARIWRWRALGLSHPKRSPGRSRESMANLKSILGAIGKGDAEAAERITRDEANKAAEEVMRLLAGEPAGGTDLS